MRGNRQFWSMLLFAVVAVVVLQALAGTAGSPVERLLHIHVVPRWWPFVAAGAVGVIGGSLLQRPGAQQGGAATSTGARTRGKGDARPATRGRHAVPRHVRRERERQRRHEQRVEAGVRRRAEEAEEARREADRAAAAAAPAEDVAPARNAWLRRLVAPFARRGQG